MNVFDFLFKKDKYVRVLNDILDDNLHNIYMGNTACNAGIALASQAFITKKQNIIYITENIYNASRAYETFCDTVGADNVSFFPVEEFISSELVASSSAFRLARMLTLYNICENNPKIIITCTEGITKKVMSKEKISAGTIKVATGDIINMRSLVLNLINRGYKKASITEEQGSFSVRGSIVDVFPINSNNVYRINFFDDEVENIKIIDITTQMSIQKVENIYIFPLYDMYYDENEIPLIIERILKDNKLNVKLETDIEKIKNYESLDQLSIYLPYIDPNYISFLELLEFPICIYEDLSRILTHERDAGLEIKDYLRNVGFTNYKKSYISINDCIQSSNKNIFISQEISSLNDIKLDKLIDLKTTNCFEYNNNLKNVIEDIKVNKNKTYIITHFDDKKISFLKEVFNNHELIYNCEKIINAEVNLIIDPKCHGFIDYEYNFEILTPFDYAPGKINKSNKYQKYYNNSTKIYDKDELNPGDYVVHQVYGIGIYRGIETMELHGSKNDYLVLQYEGERKLLVPVENIYILEKYNCSSDAKPKLNNLSGKDWEKKKAKVKEKVIEVAKKLIKIQAERELKQGYIYAPDTKYQFEFESDFEFEETPDQKRAIDDVKKDMESTKPLDRLICGDVGFGKTEVAMRAAFKAIDNNKQIAYLAPTTVLSRQHYYTFKERFEKYGVRVELLNRFVSASKQKQVLEGLKKGYVDIVIGTHRILSNDIVFKNLGLLIIDEEQRFGVLHKEKIKELKANVDVLTLTATPIPRTLQMSLSGLKDLSLIETAPSNRLPIQTYVLETNDSVIREAINRELGRNGQVFYLLNRIDELPIIARKVKKLCPFAKIGLIHGQMDKDTIEEELEMFLDQKYNVLICTTIIETGIDIPNANTLIIEKADYLGLSQLYQIRGRVGRSDRISYAYLMYDKDKVITQDAKKRLDAIKEFTALGSGYKIAMRDLAIRGTGDILGDEQSGFIDAIGMDLYMKLLNEAINELKGITVEEEKPKHYNIGVSKHVDTSYVSDDELRILMHKEISKIRSREDIKELIDEYTDRYGKPTEEILLYMEEKYLEFLLKSRGIENIKETEKEVEFYFDVDTIKKLSYNALAKSAKKYAPDFKFSMKFDRIYVNIYKADFKDSYIYTLTKFLENI